MAKDRSGGLFTLTEVSRETGISLPTLRRYRQLFETRVPTVGEGRAQRYPREALEIFESILQERRGRREPLLRTELLTLAEIGRRTGIAYATLRRLVESHLEQIPHRGRGAQRRYYPEAVAVFERLARSERGSRARGPVIDVKIRGKSGSGSTPMGPILPALEERLRKRKRQIIRLNPAVVRTFDFSRASMRTGGGRGGGALYGAGAGSLPGAPASSKSVSLGGKSPRRTARRKAKAPRKRKRVKPSAKHKELETQAPGGTLDAPKPRYANAALLEPKSDQRLSPTRPVSPGSVFRLRLDIGPWSRESQVSGAQAIDEWLPKKDLWLDVVVSSTSFGVATGPEDGFGGTSRGRFFLPGDGGAATTPAGETYLFAFLRAPREASRARARVCFYYRDALVQSLLLEADVGSGLGGFRITVDFSLSHSLADLDAIPDKPRVSLLVNDNGDQTHQVVLRAGRSEQKRIEATSEVEAVAVSRQIEALRDQLKKNAPQTRKRRRDQLQRDLWELAPLAWKLHAGMWKGLPKLDPDPETFIIHVTRPQSSGFAFPWSLLYDIPLDQDALRRKEVRVCPLVERWDGKTPLLRGDQVTGDPRRCPAADEVSHDENLLCPFGFWGYRYSIEQLSSRRDVGIEVPVPEDFSMVVAKTQRVADKKELQDHVEELRGILHCGFPRAVLSEGEDKQTLRKLLGRDLPLVYFYCHGNRLPGDPHTYLGIGKDEALAAEDFIGWLAIWQRAEHRTVWDKVRPLIFINACHSAELQPEMLVSYQDAFIGSANATGIIGTEVKVDQGLAMELASRFFELFVEQRWTVDRALRRVRLEFLADGNLFGLVYTPYCWADLQLVAGA